ncbi:hypothetical protein LWI28_025864 [Acer negundo]|uniref:Small ribosomal subunit protein eS31 domain-containing protein n=1 Tax=Acer negundo TaxID=4023 RepID=A0AAD5NJ04_ACENE|nr:hypothetical protein LWI28_025864 [Acer negundo]
MTPGRSRGLRKECPNAECGAGTFMANHFDRHYYGKCGNRSFVGYKSYDFVENLVIGVASVVFWKLIG